MRSLEFHFNERTCNHAGQALVWSGLSAKQSNVALGRTDITIGLSLDSFRKESAFQPEREDASSLFVFYR